MKIRHKMLYAAAVLSLFIGTAASFANTGSASALTGGEFNAGRIIDDSIFFNANTMTVADIQNFMNAKVPTCDTWGAQPYNGTTRAAYGESRGYPPPYTCLKEYRQDTTSKAAEPGLCNGYSAVNQSSAEIILGVAQSCGINPKVLLVLLQKEQSLVTDDWPWSIQYRSATGYGCPDTSACDSQYYGFFNQVYSAARGYKNYAANPGNYNYRAGRDNTIYFNPGPCQTRNSSGTCTLYYGRFGTQPDIQYCGSTTVFIQNQATADLYIYTPYQPNPAALNNLYGNGDVCSSYGNRNFWRLFMDWFGYTTGPGYEFVDAVNPPATVLPNDMVNARIRIRNRTGTTWYSDGNVPAGQHAMRLAIFGYENNPYGNLSDPDWLGTKNQLRMQETSVPDGGVATFNMSYRGPLQQVNNFFSRFVPVFDGVGFLPYIGLSFTTSTPSPVYGYQVVASSGVVSDLPTGFTQAISYTVRNTGNIVWWNESAKPAGSASLRIFTVGPYYHPSSFYDSGSWLANNQIALSTSRVNPGADGTFSFNIKTPSSNGIFGEWFGLVLDGAALYPYDTQMSWIMNVADYNFSVVSVDMPSQLLQGQKYTAKVVVKNTGVATWYADGSTPPNTNPVRLMTAGYRPHQLADTSSATWMSTNNQVRMVTASVAPGQNAEFDIDLVAPYTACEIQSDFRLVLDGIYIMRGNVAATTSVPARSGNYTMEPGGVHPAPSPISPGQITTGKLVVKNNTNFVWYSDSAKPTIFRGGSMRMVMIEPFYRSSPFANSSDTAWLGSSNQITMATPVVNPGQNAEFDYTWKAPSQTGTYTDKFSLVLDGYQLMTDIGMQIVTTVQ
jgi:hypothetical protein